MPKYAAGRHNEMIYTINYWLFHITFEIILAYKGSLEWYIKKGIPLDVNHFLTRAKDTNDWPNESISNEQIIELLEAKIKAVSFSSIKEDVVRFIPNDDALDIWSVAYFKDLIGKIKFEDGGN